MWPFDKKEALATTRKEGRPSTIIEKSAENDQCPVDEKTRTAWLSQNRGSTITDDDDDKSSGKGGGKRIDQTSSALAFLKGQETIKDERKKHDSRIQTLSTDRVVSSIPRFSMSSSSPSSSNDDSNATSSTDPNISSKWVYPSPAQFFSAMQRKNHNPNEQDMNIVVPIHNAVNERAWHEILQWERLISDGKRSFTECGGPKLVSFKGRPRDVTWHAWTRSLMGYERPFDRHDWIVDRCGKRITYVIDFYTGRSSTKGGRRGSTKDDEKNKRSLSFYLDVRPSPSQWEGLRMRFIRLFTPSSK